MRRWQILCLCVLAVSPVLADELAYGQIARYVLNSAVSYPDFRVVYRGERVAAEHGGRRVRDFEIYTDCTMFPVSWPVGSTEPLAIDSGVGPLVFEFSYSRALKRALGAQEFIAWDQAGYDQQLALRR